MLQAEGLGWAKVPKYVWKLQVSCSLLVMGVELSESQTGEEPCVKGLDTLLRNLVLVP